LGDEHGRAGKPWAGKTWREVQKKRDEREKKMGMGNAKGVANVKTGT